MCGYVTFPPSSFLSLPPSRTPYLRHPRLYRREQTRQAHVSGEAQEGFQGGEGGQDGITAEEGGKEYGGKEEREGGRGERQEGGQDGVALGEGGKRGREGGKEGGREGGENNLYLSLAQIPKSSTSSV